MAKTLTKDKRSGNYNENIDNEKRTVEMLTLMTFGRPSHCCTFPIFSIMSYFITFAFHQVNNSEQNWTLLAKIDGSGFHGPEKLNCPRFTTVSYSLQFQPLYEGVVKVGRAIGELPIMWIGKLLKLALLFV